MPATRLDGKAVASDIRNEVSAKIASYTVKHGEIRLCAVLVGSDPASRLYAQSQRHRCLQAGVKHDLIQLPADITQPDLLAELDRLNADPTVTGIMIQMPLPPHLDPTVAQYRLDPYKDVEGVNPANIGLLFYDTPIIAPCTALAVIELIRRSGVELRGADAVVIGQSPIVGRPVSMFLKRPSWRPSPPATSPPATSPPPPATPTSSSSPSASRTSSARSTSIPARW